MRDVWRRWRRYFRQLDDVLRVCGRQLQDTDDELRREFELDRWRLVQREAAERERVRRAYEEPFFRSLIDAARRWPTAETESSEGERYRPFPEGESVVVQTSVPGVTAAGAETTTDDAPPARILAAERAIRQRTRSLTVLVERLVNPQNAAAIARSAEFFGLQEVHLIQKQGITKMSASITRSCDKYLDRFWYRDTEAAVTTLRERGTEIWVADFGAGSIPLDEVPVSKSMAIALGGERSGVSTELRSRATGTFHIPGAGFTAYLNVSTTAAIALQAVDREQRRAGLRAPLAEDERRTLRESWFSELARGNRWREQEFASWIERAAELSLD